MTGVKLKQLINKITGIPKGKLRAQCGGYHEVRIIPERSDSYRDPLKYLYLFKPELGQQCMGIVYHGHPTLSLQSWGGNVGSTSIAMRPGEWKQLFALYGESYE